MATSLVTSDVVVATAKEDKIRSESLRFPAFPNDDPMLPDETSTPAPAPMSNATKSLLLTLLNDSMAATTPGWLGLTINNSSNSAAINTNGTLLELGLTSAAGAASAGSDANAAAAAADEENGDGAFYERIPPELFYRHSFVMGVIYCVAYLAVFVVGLIGNSFVVAVVWRAPRMRTVTNYFIVNLAVADILVIVFCLPATLISNIYVPWMLGWVMCKTVPYVQGVAVAASVYSLIAVSLDRFLAICFPLKFQITKRRARIIIIVIWGVSIVALLPWALFFDLNVVPELPHISLCLEVWPEKLNGKIYFLLANLLSCYVLPTVLISLCYILIWVKVCRRNIPTDTKDAQMERMQQNCKIKVVKMLVAVVIIFVLSWLPLYAIFARIKLGGEIREWEENVLQLVTPFAQWLGVCNSCINPILYAFFNNKFRRGFAILWKSKQCCSTLRYEAAAFHSSTIHRSSCYASSIRVPDSTSVAYIYNNTGV